MTKFHKVIQWYANHLSNTDISVLHRKNVGNWSCLSAKMLIASVVEYTWFATRNFFH